MGRKKIMVSILTRVLNDFEVIEGFEYLGDDGTPFFRPGKDREDYLRFLLDLKFVVEPLQSFHLIGIDSKTGIDVETILRRGFFPKRVAVSE